MCADENIADALSSFWCLLEGIVKLKTDCVHGCVGGDSISLAQVWFRRSDKSIMFSDVTRGLVLAVAHGIICTHVVCFHF